MASQTVFGKRTSAPKRVSQGALRASAFASLLHEVAPDIILRELSRSGTTWTPELYRGVISVLLRSSTTSVATRAYRVLKNGKQGNEANRLGFTALSSNEEKRNVIQDIIVHSVRDEMLRSNEHALSFYNSAGNGAQDVEEYETPQRDGLAESDSFGEAQVPLASVRRLALSLYLRHMADFSASLITNDSRIRTLLCNEVCMNSHLYNEELRNTLQYLLHKLIIAESSRGRDNIVSSLVTAFSSCASGDNHQALGIFLNSMQAIAIQHDSCLMFLQQRFGVDKSLKGPLTALDLANYILDIYVKSSRQKMNKVLPAVVAALCSSWVQNANVEVVRQVDQLLMARMISSGEELIRKCNPPKDDATWLRMVLLDIKTVRNF